MFKERSCCSGCAATRTTLQALYEAIGKAAQQWAEECVLLGTGSLTPTTAGTRIHRTAGEITTTSTTPNPEPRADQGEP